MSDKQPLSIWYQRVMHIMYARWACLAKPATGFVSQPEPRSIGSFARGRQLISGNLMFAGHLIEAPNAMIWDLDPPDRAFAEEIHGFTWLDDLVSVGDANARALAQEWLFGWISKYDSGVGSGWLPDLTGRRLIRWIHHAPFVLSGQSSQQSARFFRALGRQTIFLSRRWKKTTPGLARFEALTGLTYAGLSLSGMEQHITPATIALSRECREQIDKSGGILTRNPEELLDVFTLLSWAAAALRDANWTPGAPHLDAIDRIAPTLRSLRHADGGLARFHGGGRGLDGRLDQALLQSGNKTYSVSGLSMGYARLSGGRTTVIVDAAPPPLGRASMNAHASTLAFEMTSGRRPLIVNSGSGVSFGEKWRRAGRATPSHSTVYIQGHSSARLGNKISYAGIERELLVDGPNFVPVEMTNISDAIKIQLGHDGYVATHGLTHVRSLELSQDGSELSGEDLLMAIEDNDKLRFDRVLEETKLLGSKFEVKFHIHPEVEVELDMGGQAVSLTPKSGEVWVLRTTSNMSLKIEPSFYLEKGRLHPRSTTQVILSGRAIDYATRIRWSFAKAYDKAVPVRDVSVADLIDD